MNDPDHSLLSERERVLLEKIDGLTERLVICEHAILQLEQFTPSRDAAPAIDPGEIEERLRRRLEQQTAGLSAELERRQSEFTSKQRKLLELLAAELRKIRSMTEANTGTLEPATPAARPETRTTHLRRRANDKDNAELDFFEIDRDAAGSSPEQSAPLSKRARESQDLEFWDWLESLPRKPVDEPAANDITYDDLSATARQT